MIRFLKGTVYSVGKDHIVLDTGFFGFEILTDEESLSSIKEGEDVVLYTYITFGDEPKIFGFPSEKKRELFIKLLSVSKLGPKTALKILNAGPDRVVRMIKEEDVSSLSSIPGIGRKMAERIIIELKDKLEEFESKREDAMIDEVVQALKALGFSSKEAYDAAKMVKNKGDLSEMIKEALNILVGKK